MELSLKIYNELDEVVHEYKRNSYSIRMGQLKKIIETLDLERVAKWYKSKEKTSNEEALEIASNLVLGSYERVKELIQDIFPGLTDEEYENVRLNEVAQVLINAGKYALTNVSILGSGRKN